MPKAHRKKSLEIIASDCHRANFPSAIRIVRAKKTKNLSIAGSRIVPNGVTDLRRLAKYPSKLSVNIAKKMAAMRKETFSVRKRKARGALRKDNPLEMLNIVSIVVCFLSPL